MKRRRVWRYACEFCKKSNCSAASISRHEKRCTLNPDRYCGMCRTVEHEQMPMPELLAVLSHVKMIETDPGGEYNTLALKGDMDGALSKLVDATENCPACILAAIRQSGILVPLSGFNYTEAVKEFWGYVNESNRPGDYY